jgi:hypothetical protein
MSAPYRLVLRYAMYKYNGVTSDANCKVLRTDVNIATKCYVMLRVELRVLRAAVSELRFLKMTLRVL